MGMDTSSCLEIISFSVFTCPLFILSQRKHPFSPLKLIFHLCSLLLSASSWILLIMYIFTISLTSATSVSSLDPSTFHKHMHLFIIQNQNKKSKKLSVKLLLLPTSTQDLIFLYSILSKSSCCLLEVFVSFSYCYNLDTWQVIPGTQWIHREHMIVWSCAVGIPLVTTLQSTFPLNILLPLNILMQLCGSRWLLYSFNFLTILL